MINNYFSNILKKKKYIIIMLDFKIYFTIFK